MNGTATSRHRVEEEKSVLWTQGRIQSLRLGGDLSNIW